MGTLQTFSIAKVTSLLLHPHKSNVVLEFIGSVERSNFDVSVPSGGVVSVTLSPVQFDELARVWWDFKAAKAGSHP